MGPRRRRRSFLYLVGGLLGFGALAVLAYGQLSVEVQEGERTQEIAVVSMIHFGATLGNLLLGYLFVEAAFVAQLPPSGGFLAAGFLLSFAYNVFLLAEEVVSRAVVRSTATDD
jgi:hypothetical protein